VRTDPGEAAGYAVATGVDALAVAVGSSHAMTERNATLDHELIRRLRAAVPVPLPGIV
jgi:fructose-bisphosphate aldolase class II